MNPYYFGTHERRLFGIHEAAQRSVISRGVVLCHPWGGEYIHAYRAMRQLSKMLSANGIHTLRFDYFGTGDSDGETSVGDFSGWEADIESAIGELKEAAGATRISLIGLRLGATLAANVAVRVGAEINSLVLWDPVVSGVEYLAEVQRAARTGWLRPRSGLVAPAHQRRGHEAMGLRLTETDAAALRRIDLAAVAPALPDRTLLVASQPLGSHASFQRALDQRQPPLAIEHIDSPPGWIEWPVDHPLAGTVPVKVLQRIVEWLT
jgi:uncharacterized protein